MFDRPALADAEITTALRQRYGIETRSLEFLALGHDANAWTFRAESRSGQAWFLKLRRAIDLVKLAAVAYLQGHGLPEVVAPLATIDSALSVEVGGFVLVTYPFLEARTAVEAGLTDAQWAAYGDIVRRLHSTVLPEDLARGLPRETFVSRWVDVADRVEAAIDAYRGDDRPTLDVIATWTANRALIDEVSMRTRWLQGRLLARLAANPGTRARFVPCHADIHTHNVLVDAGGGLHVIDWDELMLAPRERDLMFVMDCPIGLAPRARETALFLEGYGATAIDRETLAFYRADWAIQDVASYAEQALDRESASLESRAYAVTIFRTQFEPDDEIEVALRSELDGDAPIIPA